MPRYLLPALLALTVLAGCRSKGERVCDRSCDYLYSEDGCDVYDEEGNAKYDMYAEDYGKCYDMCLDAWEIDTAKHYTAAEKQDKLQDRGHVEEWSECVLEWCTDMGCR